MSYKNIKILFWPLNDLQSDILRQVVVCRAGVALYTTRYWVDHFDSERFRSFVTIKLVSRLYKLLTAAKAATNEQRCLLGGPPVSSSSALLLSTLALTLAATQQDAAIAWTIAAALNGWPILCLVS